MKRLIPLLLLLVASTAFAAPSSVSRHVPDPDSPSKLMLVGARTAPTYSMFTANQWQGYVARNITNATFSPIVSNTATTLTIQSTTATVNTNTYQIIRSRTADGTHPSPYGHELMAVGIDTTQLV